MKLGILETGKLIPGLEAKYGTYPDMFVRLLDGYDLELEFEYFAVLEEVFPESVDQCDAWLVTGSKHGAYDELPWIPRLEQFILELVDKKIPLIGICFGHQIIAQVLGGKVIKSKKGWGLGVQEYKVTNPAPWMNGALNQDVAVNAIHQDQVIELPQGAEILASSDFCPNAMLAYGDTIFTVQPHPEIEHDYQADLIEARRGDVFDDNLADSALASLAQSIDNHQVADWMIGFLKQHA